MIEPVVLGGGKRLFPDDGTKRPFELASTSTASTGVLICNYRRVRILTVVRRRAQRGRAQASSLGW
jgi:hypothetical protein